FADALDLQRALFHSFESPAPHRPTNFAQFVAGKQFGICSGLTLEIGGGKCPAGEERESTKTYCLLRIMVAASGGASEPPSSVFAEARVPATLVAREFSRKPKTLLRLCPLPHHLRSAYLR